MRSRFQYIFVIVLVLSVVSGFFLTDKKPSIDEYVMVGRAAAVHPDNSGTVVPANIAPLNFAIQEKGSSYFVKIYSEQGRAVEVFSRKPEIIIPLKTWRRLLKENRGKELYFDIYVKTGDGQWNKFESITSRIASDDIDNYLVYRKIHPGHGKWREMGVYQRNLENFRESVVLHNDSFEHDCVNCHAFRSNRTDRMTVGIRSASYGSSVLMTENRTVEKIGAKFGYTAWHPSGKVVAYSINGVKQFFHAIGDEVRDVIDLDSLLAYYLVDSKKIKTADELSRKDRLETYPAWSPDGRYLYFSSAPILWSDQKTFPPERYKEVKYDIVRISYDVESDKWGQIETVVSAKETGLSCLESRISPDGRWLLFVMCDYGCFPVYRQSSDLYLVDLKAAGETGKFEYRRLDINSNESESWHSFSSNSRWMVFSSKRDYGVFTRSYISYIDDSGKVHKPIVLPQKDPYFYDSYTETFSVPELIAEPVRVRKERLGRVVRSGEKIPVEMPITMATRKAGEPVDGEAPWLGGRE